MKKTIILLFICVFLYACKDIAAGSYPYAEVYDVKVDKESIINTIIKIKEENSNYKVPKKYEFIDANDKEFNSYDSYFFVENKVYCFFVKNYSDSTTTSIVFRGVFEKKDKYGQYTLKNYKEINKDDDAENKQEKKFFEGEILSKILKGLKTK